MKLSKVTIYKYKSFLTEQSVDIEPDITRIVGKNESGKSALLEAVAKTRYFDEKDITFKFDKDLDYPRSQLMKVKQDNPEAVRCEYSLSDDEMEEIEDYFSPGILKSRSFGLITKYDGNRTVDGLSVNFDAFKTWLIETYGDDDIKVALKECNDFATIYKVAGENKADTDWAKLNAELEKLKTSTKWSDVISGFIYSTYISPSIPKFWYFSDYFNLPARINISKYETWLANSKPSTDENAEGFSVVSALFELSGLTVKDLKEEANFESFTATLEATSNSITDEMFDYWKTNENLEIEFRLEHNPSLYLNIRVKNKIHRVTLPLKNRSKGFLWFFSFLVWFNKLQGDKNTDYILLLDEPGLSLHAAAQRDLLRFIEERLAPDYQVIYTTHSPFMIDSLKLDQVRTVYDTQDPKVGSVISPALEEKDSDTLFPLQAALGYTLAQNLYVSEKNLLVEGVSDLVYLSHFSSLLNEEGREGLNNKITIVPVGGAEKVATFISLMRGNELNCVCLLDTLTEQKAKDNLRKMVDQKLIADKKILFADSFTSFQYADIEDFFTPDDYLKLYNGAFETKVKKNELDSSKGIMGQLKRLNGDKAFNHYAPSRYMMAHIGELQFSDDTLNAFEEVFKTVNKLLK